MTKTPISRDAVLEALFSAIKDATKSSNHPEDVMATASIAVESIYLFVSALPLGAWNTGG